jgi:uncharacterized coiled-coil protein SlyX
MNSGKKVSTTMCAIHGSVSRVLLVSAGVMGFVAACNRQSGLDHKLQEMAVIAQRDSLLGEVAANGKLLGEIQDELSKVQPKAAGGTPESPALEVTTDQRTFVMERVKDVTKRVKDLQTRLANSEKRAGRLSRQADSLGTEFSAAKASIENLNAMVATQQQNLTTLTGQIEQLTGENAILADSVLHLTDDHNTAFYVIGTRAELLAKGVLVEDGHKDVPLFGTRGVAPARELPLQEFTSIDRTSTRQIPLPRADRKYRIVTRQNLAYLTPGSPKKGQVKGEIAIASPDRFWEASRYLIVVEQ